MGWKDRDQRQDRARYGDRAGPDPRGGQMGYGDEPHGYEDFEQREPRNYAEEAYGQNRGYGQNDYAPPGRPPREPGQPRFGEPPPGREGREGYSRGGFGQGSYGQSDYGRSTFPAAKHPSFRSRAPKGYERSDEKIRELICERLIEDPEIDATDVSVNVAKGVVTLEGSVQDRRTKYVIEDVAENCGAKDVQNRLRIGTQPPDPQVPGPEAQPPSQQAVS